MTFRFFYSDSSDIITNGEDRFVAVIPSVSDEEKLYDELNYRLQFPYFGRNWDALWDLYCDFRWMEEREKREIYIYHQELKKLSSKDLKKYINIIRDSIEDRKYDYEYKVYMFFNKEEETLINDCWQGRSVWTILYDRFSLALKSLLKTEK